ncbi:MAG: hypothetical protein RIR18_792 [Pseudomonadota bacterium]
MFNIIPADVASRIKQANDSVSATLPVRKLKDALADLVPGQRVFAQIQSLLPNGAYRAIVAQRDIVLALPHSAKAGDTLELEVVENDGHIAFALLQPKSSSTEGITRESVATSLSKTGQLISDLLSPPGKEGQKPPSLVLNGNQPLFTALPTRGADIAPALEQSIVQSGMFYESHQVAWAEGKLPTAMLLSEPQGQFSSVETKSSILSDPSNNPFDGALHHTVQPDSVATTATPTDADRVTEKLLDPSSLTSNRPANNAIPPSLNPIVQQQLEAFASQNYAWQGTAWPGQAMEWEISDQGSPQSGNNDEDEYRWQTSLKLQLPTLGNISATLRLRGDNQIDVQIQTGDIDSEIQLSLGGPALNQQLDDAGLYLAMFGVTHAGAEQDLPDEQADE